MNELDRKIALLKGWTITGNGPDATWAEPNGIPSAPARHEAWSQLDGKAMELIDELVAIHPEFGATLTVDKETGHLWNAIFHVKDQHVVRTEGSTRCEVVCEAYVQMREWINAQPEPA